MVNRAFDPAAVPPVDARARPFHAALAGYAPTPVRALADLAAEIGVASITVKDESDRLGLPAFKALGASWAVELALRTAPDTRTLVAASAGNHGRAVARVAALRGLACRVFVPARSVAARRDAIRAEGAELVVVDGSYEDAVARAGIAGREPGALEIADVGSSPSAAAVIDGYATLFAELAEQTATDALLVPVGVGSLAAAAARFGAAAGIPVIGVEPETAACLAASLTAGEPTAVATPGTVMAGMDCAAVSPAAWPSLRPGITGVVTVGDAELPAAIAWLAAAGMEAGECAAATVAAAVRLLGDPELVALRHQAGLGATSRLTLIGTEGPTGRDAGAPAR